MTTFKKIVTLTLLPLLLAGCNNIEPSSSTEESLNTSSEDVTSEVSSETTSEDVTSEGGSYDTSDTSATSQGTSTTSTTSEGKDPTHYYDSILDGYTGDNLKSELNKLNNKNRVRQIGYKNHRYYYKYTEKLPETPEGKMYGFYDDALISDSWDNQATWNHEHVWPKSLGGGSVDDDMHMPRPTSVKINSDRGNQPYGKNYYDPGQWIPEYRGVAARIIFYCAIANTSLDIDYSTDSHTMGILNDLLEWNLAYPPTKSETAATCLRVEQVRNENIYARPELQGNRNPFIDHPEYACRIWGSRDAKTKKACGLQ